MKICPMQGSGKAMHCPLTFLLYGICQGNHTLKVILYFKFTYKNVGLNTCINDQLAGGPGHPHVLEVRCLPQTLAQVIHKKYHLRDIV